VIVDNSASFNLAKDQKSKSHTQRSIPLWKSQPLAGGAPPIKIVFGGGIATGVWGAWVKTSIQKVIAASGRKGRVEASQKGN